MNIDLNRTEQAKSDFIDALMAYNSVGVSPRVKRAYGERIKRSAQAVDSIEAVAAVLVDEPAYKFLAFFERHNHAMVFQTTQEVLNARRDEVLAWLDEVNGPGALGSLELNPKLGVPHYYRRLEIHRREHHDRGSLAQRLVKSLRR